MAKMRREESPDRSKAPI